MSKSLIDFKFKQQKCACPNECCEYHEQNVRSKEIVKNRSYKEITTNNWKQLKFWTYKKVYKIMQGILKSSRVGE